MTAPSSTVTFQIEAPIYTALSRKAKAEGIATGRYARMLFEAAYAARCKPQGDKELEAAINRMFKATILAAPAPDAKPSPFEEKWLTATNTIQSLRERIAELEARPAVAPSDDAALRAKITELSAQIVAAAEDKAVVDSVTREAARLQFDLSQANEAAVGLQEMLDAAEDLVAQRDRMIAALKAELAEAKALPPPVLKISTDELVTAIVMGWGASFDSAAMADRTGLSEATVSRILGAWRDEIQSRKAA